MESRTRTAGVLLLVLGLVVTEYVPTRWMQSMQSGSMPNYRALSALLAIGPVLIVLGAGFLAVSVVLRGLVHRQGTRFIRWQLATGVALIAAGIAARVWGDEVGNNLVDFLWANRAGRIRGHKIRPHGVRTDGSGSRRCPGRRHPPPSCSTRPPHGRRDGDLVPCSGEWGVQLPRVVQLAPSKWETWGSCFPAVRAMPCSFWPSICG